MRTIFTVTLLLVLSGVLNGQQPGVHADANPAAEGEIKALELRLADLIVRGGADEYQKLLASDYLHTLDNGHVENKDEVVKRLREANRQVIVMEMEPDIAIRIYGDTAVSNAEFTIRVRENGQVKSRRLRLTDVLLKREGQWCLIAEQGTAIGK